MSQITCCPNCSTTFRVTDAQLAAHQGKVRCGRCAFVFHAPDFIQSLIVDSPQAAAPSPSTTSHIPESAPTSALETQYEEIKQGIQSQTKEIKAQKEIHQEKTQNPPKNDHDKLIQLAKDELELDAALSKAEAQLKQHATGNDASESSQHERPSIAIDSDSEYQPILTEDDLFSPTKSGSRFTWAWALGCLIALLVLLAQSVFVFRNELSQEFPALRPKLIVLCEHLNCTLPLPREAQLLRSEYSELTFIPNSPTLIQLNATLRNLAPFAQELPKLEVTLTDENEKVIVRKIFTAKQYMVQNERAQNSIEANEEIRAFLQLDLGSLHSTGYSLYWFY